MSQHEARLLEMVRQKREGIFPSIVLQTAATAEEQLTCARSFMRRREELQKTFIHQMKKPGGRIKIGYLSEDYREHATAYLMAELFEKHDRARFEITAYSYGPDDNSPMRSRLMKAFDSFVDVRSFTDREAAQKIHDDGIDILIDLKGLTGESRYDIAAYRPAPVQVNFLGYPGTMGASFIDYIIADRFIIPEDQEKYYSEKVVCLPDCYQPNDTHRVIAETTPTRKECGLPEQAFVFCCFNISYKIKPQTFDIWMRLLQKLPGSVLWLFEANQSVNANLKQEAARRGIDPERLIFAPRARLPEHLARHRRADLFLDTLPINAHTTTSDALWAGLPVLTCAGNTFAGRVAGSLLKAAHLPELIVMSSAEYETLALQLAQQPEKLAAIRRKLEQTRLQMPLFDIEMFTRNLEKSYQTMWDIWQAGENPRAFSIT
jgi:protein O-GlcNAc transferase